MLGFAHEILNLEIQMNSKKLSTLIFLLLSISAFAQNRTTLDDLGSIRLRTDKKQLGADVHYPNYRMGGGTPPTRQIRDCFILDVLDSDNSITNELKMDIAQELKVLEGFSFDTGSKVELTPEFKGNNVVFKVRPGNLYLTSFIVSTRGDRKLNDMLTEKMPGTRLGNSASAVNLLYVRGCRL